MAAAAGDLVQLGTSVVVGFNSRTVGTWIMEDSGESPGCDIKEIRGPQNAVVTKLLTNPHKTVKATGVMLSADLTAMASAKIGDSITINSIKYMILSLDISFGTQDAKASLTAIKEDSMTYA